MDESDQFIQPGKKPEMELQLFRRFQGLTGATLATLGQE